MYLWTSVEFENSYANVLQVRLVAAEEEVPGRFLWQDYAQLAGAQVDAGARDGLGAVAHKDVGP